MESNHAPTTEASEHGIFMHLTHIIGQRTEEEPESETARSDRRRLGRYLLVGGTVVAIAALAGRRRRRHGTEREMTTIEIQDNPATLGR